MTIYCAALVLAGMLARTAIAQSPLQPPAAKTPIGIWRGTSVCLVRESACNDERVIYRITRMKARDSVAVDARKIVRGKEQKMGVLGCGLTAASGDITCRIPRALWRFSVRDDSLTGELRLLDNTRFREVHAARSPSL